MLHKLAEADPPRMRANRNWGEETDGFFTSKRSFLPASVPCIHTCCSLVSSPELLTLELVRHQQHSQVLVDASQATAVYLNKLEGWSLKELLKHHPVMALGNKTIRKSINNWISFRQRGANPLWPVLLMPRRFPTEPKPAKHLQLLYAAQFIMKQLEKSKLLFHLGNSSMTQDVIWTRGLLDPERSELSQAGHPSDGLSYVPPLVSVDHLRHKHYWLSFRFKPRALSSHSHTRVLLGPIISRMRRHRRLSSSKSAPTFTLNLVHPFSSASVQSCGSTVTFEVNLYSEGDVFFQKPV